MGIFSKVKDFFKAARENADKKVEEVMQPAPKPVIEVRGDLIGQCALCGYAIGSEDRSSNLNGKDVHRRCFKKAKKMTLQGKSQEEMAKAFIQ